MSNAAELRERQVAKQVTDFMEYHGWTTYRNTVSVNVNRAGGFFSTGKKGMADLLFVRYLPKHPGWAGLMWIETKRGKGGSLSPDQEKWQREQRALGALVLNVNIFEDHRAWYYREFGWLHTGRGPDVPGNLNLFADSS